MNDQPEVFELKSLDELMDVLAGNVEAEDLREFKRAGVNLGHA